jgi:hypothetical protein
MRYLVMMTMLALTGCSSQWVRCERHLTPINGARSSPVAAVGTDRHTVGGPGRGAQNSKSEGRRSTLPAGGLSP